jgi:hypothetical protein
LLQVVQKGIRAGRQRLDNNQRGPEGLEIRPLEHLLLEPLDIDFQEIDVPLAVLPADFGKRDDGDLIAVVRYADVLADALDIRRIKRGQRAVFRFIKFQNARLAANSDIEIDVPRPFTLDFFNASGNRIDVDAAPPAIIKVLVTDKCSGSFAPMSM